LRGWVEPAEAHALILAGITRAQSGH
jgi:hypothetical protein